MKILVTGACGFIGSQLAETLVRRGHDVRAMVYYNAFNSFGWLDRSPEVTSMQIIPGDVRDASCVREAMRGCELVYHLAALIGIPYSYRAPESYVQTNVIGTLNVIQAAHELGDIKVVHTSTSEVYGSAQIIPITEQHPLSAQSPYAASKIGADQMALSYYRSFGSPIAIARPFNTFGPRQSNRAVIPTIITQIASGVRRIKLGSTTPTRDFNFVDDTVNGLIAVGERFGI
jgi:NAD dependent epimerase/dehydratase